MIRLARFSRIHGNQAANQIFEVDIAEKNGIAGSKFSIFLTTAEEFAEVIYHGFFGNGEL